MFNLGFKNPLLKLICIKEGYESLIKNYLDLADHKSLILHFPCDRHTIRSPSCSPRSGPRGWGPWGRRPASQGSWSVSTQRTRFPVINSMFRCWLNFILIKKKLLFFKNKKNIQKNPKNPGVFFSIEKKTELCQPWSIQVVYRKTLW